MKSPTERLMEAYESAYRFFRDELIIPVLGEELPDPILTFSRSKKKTPAFFLPDTWAAELNESQRHCELAIVPEHTGEDPRVLMSTLVHEMVHFADHIAVTHRIEADGPYAKAYDRLPKSILLPFVAGLHDVVATENADENPDQEKKKLKSGQRVKYACPQCETTMRGPAERKLICGDCEVPYESH